MVRTILSHPRLGGEPLAELKQFLSITTPSEDALLSELLLAAHALCESFAGLTLLAASYEEFVPADGAWHRLASRPVAAVDELALVDTSGNRETIDPGDYEARIQPDGSASVRLKRAGAGSRLAVRITAKLADDWSLIPADLRHGLIRLAAHAYRERDRGPLDHPPASVAALWRPHRRLRL